VKDKDVVPIITVYGRHNPMRRQILPCISDLLVHILVMREDRSDTAWQSKSPVDSYWKKKAAAVIKTKRNYKRNVSWILCTACSSTLLAHALSVKFTRGIWLFAITKYEVEGPAERVVCEDVITAFVYTCEAAEVNKFNFGDSAHNLPESSNQRITNSHQLVNRAEAMFYLFTNWCTSELS